MHLRGVYALARPPRCHHVMDDDRPVACLTRIVDRYQGNKANLADTSWLSP